MKVEFKIYELEVFYESKTIRGKQKYPREVIKQYKKKVDLLISIDNINELRPYRGLNFEALKGDKKGKYSIRLNDQYRLIFELVKTKKSQVIINIVLINEISKHYA